MFLLITSDSANVFLGLLIIGFVMTSCAGSIFVLNFEFKTGAGFDVDDFDKPIGPR